MEWMQPFQGWKTLWHDSPRVARGARNPGLDDSILSGLGNGLPVAEHQMCLTTF